MGNLFSDIVEGIGVGLEVIGLFGESDAQNDQARSLAAAAATQLAIGEEEAKFSEEMASMQAAIIEQEGASALELAQRNAALAEENRSFILGSGAAAVGQIERRWQRQIGAVEAGVGAGGLTLSGSAAELLGDQVSEFNKDVHNARIVTEQDARRERQRGELFTLEGTRLKNIADSRADATRRAGEIEAETRRTVSGLQAQVGQVQAASAAAGSSATLFRAGSTLLSGIVNFNEG